ncbi:hypothetical protein N9230_04935 [Akkermansiaceae bacterium]|nr:hypothetical protein [Akkermansiaceae bacterium]
MKKVVSGKMWLKRGLSLLALFFMVAGIGWLRERYDERAIQEGIRIQESELRERLESIRSGDSAGKVAHLFPKARWEGTKENGEVTVWVPTLYEETSSHTNSGGETYKISMWEGVVSKVRRTGGSLSHGDRFEKSELWYYFRRAWFSSITEEE